MNPAEIKVFLEFVAAIASQGILGIFLIVACRVAWAKDKEAKSERDLRIGDAKEFTKLAMDLQGKVIDATNKLSTILYEMKKMDAAVKRGNGR